MDNAEFTLPVLKCLRCGHTWIPRAPKKPKVCPNLKCKSPCLLYTSPSPRDRQKSRMPSSA